jgi:6-pyruvoyltetrahydropterin/6-carboxytetrahydropterin synthase
MEICYRFNFDAAHRFENYPAGHLYHGIHGHSFQAEVAVSGVPNAASGFVVDFAELEQACSALRGALDHKLLNEIDGLTQPSLENLCLWLWQKLSVQFPQLARVTVRRDSCNQSCTYRGPVGG